MKNNKEMGETERRSKEQQSDKEDSHQLEKLGFTMETREEHLQLIPARTNDGLGVFTAMVFLVGEMAGSGVLALPLAIANTGYAGIAIMILSAVACALSGTLLSECWLIMRQRHPDEFGGQLTSAYPQIGEYAWGKRMRYVISLNISLTSYGVCTVFLLLAAQNIQSLLALAGVHFSFCFILILLAAFLVPFSWAGSPKDFTGIGLCATFATAVAIVFILVSMFLDKSKHPDRKVDFPTPTFESIFLGFGAILFAFGGVALFPTVQQDMREPEKFPKAAHLSFVVMLTMYLPVAVGGFLIYGSDLSANVLQSLPNDWLRATAEVILTLHLLTAFIIVLNPWSQDVEAVFKIPSNFGWRRCVSRTVLVGLCLFTAESIPHFGGLLDFIGGTTVTMLNFIIPCVLYLRICSQQGEWQERKLPKWQKVLCVVLIVLGVGGGVATTYSSLKELTSPSTFVPPCYINMTAAEGS